MKNNIKIVITLLGIFLGGCSTLTKTGKVVETGIVSIPDTVRTKLHIDTSRRLEGISITKKFLAFTVASDNNFVSYSNSGINFDGFNDMQSAAIYNALNGTNYDILVMPKFSILTQKSLFTSKTVVKVTGYGAYQTLLR
jgi:hypothetical protein